MTKDVNRSAYTRRILEIVANINRQKQDINKVKPQYIQYQSKKLSNELVRNNFDFLLYTAVRPCI